MRILLLLLLGMCGCATHWDLDKEVEDRKAADRLLNQKVDVLRDVVFPRPKKK